jgi:hypothetical protein
MGNNQGTYLVDEGIHRRLSLSSSNIPVPEYISSWEELKASSTLKTFIAQNLLSPYLAFHLLEEIDESTLLIGLNSLQVSSCEEAKQVREHFTTLNNCARAGVKVSKECTLES